MVTYRISLWPKVLELSMRKWIKKQVDHQALMVITDKLSAVKCNFLTNYNFVTNCNFVTKKKSSKGNRKKPPIYFL